MNACNTSNDSVSADLIDFIHTSATMSNLGFNIGYVRH